MDERTLSASPSSKTELECYCIFVITAGVKVSLLTLGGMSIGTAYANTLGSLDKDKSFRLLDAYRSAGGNFVDTASNYQGEQSEAYIGEWMQSRDIRDEIFVSTEFTAKYRSWELGKGGRAVNYTGSSRKTLHVSVRDSLQATDQLH